MFSIAAINDSDGSKQWEPLAPTKEAQEFYLTQKYHEALLKIQSKDFPKARELLEEVLKDPIISAIQSSTINDHHLLQLRFLSLKNLASVFFQQGSEYYESALQCYIQAVELDSNDSVVWNRLGTLSCSIGSYTTARWAFEQGLKCSPNNWNCMEKLLEVLIAIGDEVSCLSISNRILKHWPSHSRALHVKKAIESVESGKRESGKWFPRGIDKLEPKHPSLNLKRKSTEDNNSNDDASVLAKKSRREIDVQVAGPTWSALLDSIIGLLKDEKSEININNRINIIFNTTSTFNELDCMELKMENSNSNSKEKEKEKEKERDLNSNTDKEPQSQERRSSRLERLRSRKSGKDDSDSKEIRNSISRNLDQFILKHSDSKESNCSSNPFNCPDISNYTLEMESDDVKQFIEANLNNSGALALGSLLLQEFADLEIPYKDYFMKILELEKLTRQLEKRTPLCSLFLAEIYFDHGNIIRSKKSEFLSDCSYHLCKIIEQAAFQMPAQRDVSEILSDGKIDDIDMVVDDTPANSPNITELEGDGNNNNDNENKNDNNGINLEKSDGYWAFWARFFFLSGNLSLSSGLKGKAHDEFTFSLSLLEKCKKNEEFGCIFLAHCKNVRFLTIDRIMQEINTIKLESLLKDENELIKKISNKECLEFLPSLLFSSKDVYKESRKVIYLEVSALDLLISACEKEENIKLVLYLKCLKRKLQLLVIAAGLDKILSDSNCLESIKPHRVERVIGVINDISRSLTHFKLFIDQNNSSDQQEALGSLICIISDIQTQLITIMRSSVKLILMRKSSSENNNSVQKESNICLVDSAILFCKLQHLDPSVSIKTQVDLIVGVHNLLAEHGLCCAGKDKKGEEGIFLKFAIKHLLALDVKLKSLHNTNGTEEEDEHAKEDSKENEMEEIEASIDSALDQNFFCLYGLNINPDSNSEEDLAIHKNTNRGEYQTKEQCADVFQYILPYAKALSRSGLVKLRRVLRAIHKHFPQPPIEVLNTNAVDKFLDGSDFCEKKILEIYESKENNDDIISVLFPDELSPDAFKKLSVSSSEPYMEVYSNIYYYVAQAEDTSATDKYAGFVLKKEGEEFVQHNANLIKYDLLYNPTRFESWQKLAYIYDEEVDLLLNDGAKHMSISEWRKNVALQERVQAGRRRSRRCLLFSLVLANSPSDQSQINELLALVYYDSLQNVVPFYDQRSVVPTKDCSWTQFCHCAMKHFEKAFALKPEWLHAFYLGKLCEKLGHSPGKAFCYYTKAAELNPTAVDPFYRLHASRVKLLYTQGKKADIIKIVASYAFKESAKETVLTIFGWKSEDLNSTHSEPTKEGENYDFAPDLLEKAWHVLYEDCLAALRICVEGELKHFHKGRFKIAQGLQRRGIAGDLEKARDELAFCFKSSRSSFTVNLWEIDGMVRKGRKKNVSVSGNRKSLEVSLSESSRKFITCIRKYTLLYLNLLEGTADVATLERAHNYLRTDRRFYLCILDVVPVSLGKYIQALTSAIRNSNDPNSLESLLEKMFNSFMDHASLWAEIGSLPEINSPDLSETNLHSYIHQYIKLLETEIRLEQLESINERIRKRFKSPKLSNASLSKIFKHASLSWCRCLLIKLALITPIPDSDDITHDDIIHDIMLYVDLQPEELLLSSPEGPVQSRGLDMNLFETLSKIKNLRIKQVSDEKMEAAVGLMRSCYNFYRESSCGNFPSGINLYTVLAPKPQVQVQEVIGSLDVSVPRKLLLWAYTVVNGRYCNIASVVKYCEEMKLRAKKGQQVISPVPALPPPQQQSSIVINTTGGGKEKGEKDESSEAAESGSGQAADVGEKLTFGIQKCGSSKSMEKLPEEEEAVVGKIDNNDKN